MGTQHRFAYFYFMQGQPEQIQATIQETVAGHLRGIVGTLTVETLYRDQKSFQDKVRDEAHRFAIMGHRQRRAKARTTSRLEQIPGLGPKKRRELLRQFGGLQGVIGAGIDDTAREPDHIATRLTVIFFFGERNMHNVGTLSATMKRNDNDIV